LNIANHAVASQVDDVHDCNECNQCAGSSHVHPEFDIPKSGAALLLVPFYRAEMDFDDVYRGQDKRD